MAMKQRIRLYDNTRLSAHRSCERKYYYRHRRHLTGAGISPALAWGAAWHEALDALWIAALWEDLPPEQVYERALMQFNLEWANQGLPPFEEMEPEQKDHFDRSKRTPAVAYRMLLQYINKRLPFMKANFMLLSSEHPFIVPLMGLSDILYVGRIDKVVRWNGSIWGIEHKTTSQGSAKSGFYKTWTAQWSLNSQIDGYIHALNMLYPGEVRGILIDGALVHRTDAVFDFIPIDRQVDQLEAWHYDVESTIGRIGENIKDEARAEHENILKAWPRNTGNCTEYNTVCPYMPFCRTLTNPELLSDGELTRDGHFTIKPWSPFDAAPLEKLGLLRNMTEEP